jgi:hypothetical protein
MLASRGGRAAPEAPFVIEHREALIYMLCEAAELEHGIMCQYLFAAFSLKQGTDEGLTERELAAVKRWRGVVAHVATEEMLHLALVHNLLSAIGAAPHFARPNLPAPASHYPAGVTLALVPFGEPALRHFMFLERPEGMQLEDAAGFAAALAHATPLTEERDIVPRGQDFATVGHLYRSIEHGFAHLAEKYGERGLFVGPPRAQATTEDFGWPELVAVTDLASAQRAIDTILEQGEGARGHWQTAHFGQFVQILDEYRQMTADNPGFDPVRPVLPAKVRPGERDDETVLLIGDPVTARVADLFNVAYEVLLQGLERYFAHTEETDEQLGTLADMTIALMLRALKPLGELITTLPVGPEHHGRTAGPSFELFYESDYLMPHREAAWTLLEERLREAATSTFALGPGHGPIRWHPGHRGSTCFSGRRARSCQRRGGHSRSEPENFADGTRSAANRVLDRSWDDLLGRQRIVDESDPCRLGFDYHACGRQQVHRSAVTDQPRQQPRDALLGRQSKPRECRELGVGRGEADVAEQCSDRAEAGRAPFIAAISGLPTVSANDRVRRARSRSSELRVRPTSASASMSVTEQKPRPAPVTTIARTSGSVSAAASSSR